MENFILKKVKNNLGNLRTNQFLVILYGELPNLMKNSLYLSQSTCSKYALYALLWDS